MHSDLWIFGYGSLVWRPDFPFAESLPAFVRGRARRFWQGSTDHRGVPEAPGRVVTLIEDPGSTCWGVAYRVADECRDEVLQTLDHRERGGFDRSDLEVTLRRPSTHRVCAITYIASSANPNYLGPAPTSVIADQVRSAHGPSGPNVEYVLCLANSLERLGVEEDPVFDLAALL